MKLYNFFLLLLRLSLNQNFESVAVKNTILIKRTRDALIGGWGVLLFNFLFPFERCNKLLLLIGRVIFLQGRSFPKDDNFDRSLHVYRSRNWLYTHLIWYVIVCSTYRSLSYKWYGEFNTKHTVVARIDMFFLAHVFCLLDEEVSNNIIERLRELELRRDKITL